MMLSEEPEPYTAEPKEGRVVELRERKEPYTTIPNAIIDLPDLDPYAFKLYMIIRRRDWGGEGWLFSYADLQEALGCGPDKLQSTLEGLRGRGLVRWEGIAKRAKRYFALTPDTALNHAPITSTSQSKTPPITIKPQSKPAPITIETGSDHDVDVIGSRLKRDASIYTKRQSKTIKGSPSHEGGAVAPRADAGTTKTDPPQYQVFVAYCAALGISIEDGDGRKARACKEAMTALRALTKRYAAEPNAGTDPAERALADLCAMVHWKARALKSGRRDVMALTVNMAYQDQAAWRKAGAPAVPQPAGEKEQWSYVLPKRKPNPDPVMEEYYQEIKRGYDNDPAYEFMRRAFGNA